ncbi:MAG: glutamine-hydrolyzing GMP synthase, partial [Candidatus Entotheonellia bacterium]
MSVEYPRETVIILDFGGQYTQLIARRVRQCHVYSEIHPWNVSLETLRRLQPRGLILSGGPASVYAPGAPLTNPAVFDLGVPVLGICYGMQLMTHQLGGQVARAAEREFGAADLTIDEALPLFADLEVQTTPVWMSHGDRIAALPPGFRAIAHSDNSPIAAMRDSAGRLYGIQFHPEVAHTPQGERMLQNFLYHVCNCSPDWTMHAFIEPAVAAIRERVGEDRV